MAVDWEYYGSIEALEDEMAALTVEGLSGTATDVEYAHRWLNVLWNVHTARRGDA